MFDIGWQELFILAVLAIIVIGPKDLPRAIKTVTHWIRKARGMARDLQDGLDDMVREADLADIKKQADDMISGDLDPTGTIARELDMTEEQQDWAKAVDDLKDATDPNRKAERVDDDDDVDESVETIAAPEPAPEPVPDPVPEAAPSTTSKASG